MKKNKYTIKPLIKKFFFSLLLLILYIIIKENTKIFKFDESTYFATWTTGIYKIPKPPINLNNNSIRQIIRVSSSGEKIRIKFSNILGNSNLEIKQVCIADSVSESEINQKTMKYLKFNGKDGVIIGKQKEIYSDSIFYPLKALSDISISIYFGKVPKIFSGHLYSRGYSYFEKGNKIKNKSFSNKKKRANWYFISSLEVSSVIPKKVVVCFGDSITDGYSNTGDTRNNYPDILSAKLIKNEKTSNISVVNEGISSEKLTLEGIKRYNHDVLDIKGVKYIIIFFGVNDIIKLNITSSQIISAYKEVIKKAHKRNIFIYAGTILPFSNFKSIFHWSKNKEKVRIKVNNWIKKTSPKRGGFDAFFDFDKYLKDPKNITKMKDIYDCRDGLHPSLEGYKKIVDCINDYNLFLK